MDHFWKITVVAAAAEVSGEEEQMSIVIWGKDVGSNKTTLFPSILTVHGNKVVLFLFKAQDLRYCSFSKGFTQLLLIRYLENM